MLCIVAALIVLAVGGGAARGQSDGPQSPDAVVIPNFWDPRARLERPSPASIGQLRFLTTDDFPPFSFRDRRGALIGFNIDLAMALCAVLETPCAVQARPFRTLLRGLNDGTGNAIIAGIDATGEDGLIATQAYLKIPARFIARTGSTFDPASASEGFVATVCGSAHAAYLGRYFPRLRVACYPTLAVALADLKSGVLEAVFGGSLSLAFWLHSSTSQDCCAFAGGPYVDDRYFGPGLSIVVRAEDRALKAALDYALREVYRSGAYEDLYLRYFPISLF
jgi:polar amino acid transport system substrate-binding protein